MIIFCPVVLSPRVLRRVTLGVLVAGVLVCVAGLALVATRPVVKANQVAPVGAAGASTAGAGAVGAGVATGGALPGSGALQPVVTRQFPGGRIYSRTLSNGAVLAPVAGPEMQSGHGLLVPVAPGKVGDPEILIKAIKAPKQYAVVQVPMDRATAFTYIKPVTNLAANRQLIYLKDKSGTLYSAVGYMIGKGNDLEFKLDPVNRLAAATQISGVNTMAADETIYLVFYIPKGVTLVEFASGNHKVPVDLEVPAQ